MINNSTVFPVFGEDIPYSEPAWYQGASTCYYKQTHVDFRALVREFVEKEIIPYVSEWEDAQEYDKTINRKAYEAGLFGSVWPAGILFYTEFQ